MCPKEKVTVLKEDFLFLTLGFEIDNDERQRECGAQSAIHYLSHRFTSVVYPKAANKYTLLC